MMMKTSPRLDEAIRYGIVGASNVVFGFAIYYLGIRLHMPYMLASAVSWTISVVASFFLTSYYIFRTPYQRIRFAKFIVMNLTSLVLNLLILAILVTGIGMSPVTSAMIAIPVVVLLNYLGSKYVIFN